MTSDLYLNETPVWLAPNQSPRKSTGPVTRDLRAFIDCYLIFHLNLVNQASELGVKFMLAFSATKRFTK